MKATRLRTVLTRSFERLVVSLGLVAFVAASTGCLVTFDVQKTQKSFQVTTSPPRSFVWTKRQGSKIARGQAPITVSAPYKKRTWVPHLWTSAIYSVLGGAAVAGGAAMISHEDDTVSGIGVVGAIVGGLAALLGVTGLILGLIKGRTDVTAKVPFTIGASKPGFDDAWTQLKIPSSKHAVHLRLLPAGGAVASTQPTTRLTRPDKRPIVAVFLIEDSTGKMSRKTAEELAGYLAIQLTATDTFRTVPRAQLRKQLSTTKKKGYKVCYDQSCQIELGKALAAQKSLSTKILAVGKICTITSVLYDLKTETSEGAATTETGCSTGELLKGLKRIAQKLAKGR